MPPSALACVFVLPPLETGAIDRVPLCSCDLGVVFIVVGVVAFGQFMGGCGTIENVKDKLDIGTYSHTFLYTQCNTVLKVSGRYRLVSQLLQFLHVSSSYIPDKMSIELLLTVRVGIATTTAHSSTSTHSSLSSLRSNEGKQ